MKPRILVTGATGRVGGYVAEGLRNLNVELVAGVRRPSQVSLDVPMVALDLAHPEGWGEVLAGVSRVFLMWPQVPVERVLEFIGAAVHAGVEHIVLLSILKADRLRVVPHRRIERCLEGAGVASTFLRASYFMQNLSTIHRPDIRHHDEVFIPAGRARTSFVDVRDVAAVAVKSLVEAPPVGIVAHELTGAQALSYHEVAEEFSDVLGRPIRCTKPSLVRFAWRMRREHGYSWSLIAFMMAEYTAARLGLAREVTGDLERLLGRPPISLRTFVRDFRDCWSPTWTSS